MSKNDSSIMGMVDKYRIKVYCFNCGAKYVTRLLEKNRTRKCKYCGSTKINFINSWKIRGF